MFSILSKITKLKVKLLIQYGIIILLTSILVGVMFISLKKISNFSDTKSVSQDVNIELLQMRRAEKNFVLEDLLNEDFFSNKTSENISNFDRLYLESTKKMNVLLASDVVNQLDCKDSIIEANKFIHNYYKSFHLLVEEYTRKGFKNWGYEGMLRDAIHKIEKGSIPFDKIQMLTLRRCEKDFLLRKDNEYVQKFDDTFKEFKSSLLKENNSALISALNDYKKEFHNVVISEQTIGLTKDDGIKKELYSSLTQAESLLGRVNTQIKDYVNQTIVNTYVLLAVLFLIQLLIAVYLAITFANASTKSVVVIKDAITELSNGVFPDKIATVNLDEIGQASVSFNNLIDRITVASDFAQKIGEGDLTISYDEKFNNDVLAKSLQSMHFQLKLVSEENEKRNWINEGLAKFVDLTRDTSDIQRFYNVILSNIVRYIGANQGYLYLLNDDSNNFEDHYMEIKGIYAYGKEKYIDEENNKIKYQEGLIGQVWFDMESLFYTEIPQDYITITSGMGYANPNCIFISPLIVNEKIVGVLEIASFEVLENHKIEFVNKIAESIASTIITVKTNEKTIKLLEQSQLLTTDLREQEEEIRQNMEEMNATNEEMNRKERSMNHRIKELESEIERLKVSPNNFEDANQN
jgi:HAMP domain-containing protein